MKWYNWFFVLFFCVTLPALVAIGMLFNNSGMAMAQNNIKPTVATHGYVVPNEGNLKRICIEYFGNNNDCKPKKPSNCCNNPKPTPVRNDSDYSPVIPQPTISAWANTTTTVLNGWVEVNYQSTNAKTIWLTDDNGRRKIAEGSNTQRGSIVIQIKKIGLNTITLAAFNEGKSATDIVNITALAPSVPDVNPIYQDQTLRPKITRLRVWPENQVVKVGESIQLEWESSDTDYITVSLSSRSYEPTWGDYFKMRYVGWYWVCVTAHSRSTSATDSRRVLIHVISNSSHNNNDWNNPNPPHNPPHDGENGNNGGGGNNHDGPNGPGGGNNDGGGHGGNHNGPN